MKLAGSFFEKFKSIAVRETQKRVIVSEIIKKELNIDISLEDISFNNGIIKIKSMSSIVKNQIYIKKETILKQIQDKGLKVRSIE